MFRLSVKKTYKEYFQKFVIRGGGHKINNRPVFLLKSIGNEN